MGDPIPNPGSDAAVAAGCRCPILDNAHGAGVLGLGHAWYINQRCSLHRDWNRENGVAAEVRAALSVQRNGDEA